MVSISQEFFNSIAPTIGTIVVGLIVYIWHNQMKRIDARAEEIKDLDRRVKEVELKQERTTEKLHGFEKDLKSGFTEVKNMLRTEINNLKELLKIAIDNRKDDDDS